MFSVRQKREIANAVQQILRATNHPELPKTGEIRFKLRVEGAEEWSWAEIVNNGAVARPGVNPHNEMQDTFSTIRLTGAIRLPSSSAADEPSSPPACSALRPTDDEIDLEARQWAEEYATRCENTQIARYVMIARQAIFAAGARWARGVAQLGPAV